LAEKLNSPFEINHALREYDCGELEGKSNPESWATYAQIFQKWLKRQWNERIPGGESRLDIQERFIPIINEISQKHIRETILLVSHGGLYRSMLPLIIENIDFDFVCRYPIEQASPIIIETRINGLFCLQYVGAIL
jgi:probable phosphoglycerate mutase